MRGYLGALSVIYIIVIVLKLRDVQKSFTEYIAGYKEIKSQLKLIGQRKDPFFAIKFANFIFYSFLFFYYAANLIFFESQLIQVATYFLIAIAAYKFIKKMMINSIEDFEKTIKVSKAKYKRQKLLNTIIGFLEFTYAFNVLSLLTLHY